MIRKMNAFKMIYLSIFTLMFFALTSCERELTDEAELAEFSNIGDVYTDNPVGLTEEFFVSFDPNVGANTEAFGTDDTEAFEGTSSIRIDVPAPEDPDGNFVGAIFLDAGGGRNLTQYDALTFWAKGSTTARIDLAGFGTDFETNTYTATRSDLQLSTNWKKYIIPIPDASKLTQERGMFVFATGTQSNNGMGFIFWMDEIRFENLGTIAQPRPKIFDGSNIQQDGFLGSNLSVSGLSQTFNISTGEDLTVFPAISYFDFESSDTSVLSVSDGGEIEVVGTGEATITASLGGVQASGSLTLNVEGSFVSAETPPDRSPEDVISIFSDAYTNVSDLNFAVFNDEDVQISVQTFNDDQIVAYETLSFIGLGWAGTSDVSNMDFLHIDVQVTNPGSFTVELIDFGSNNSEGGGDDTGGGFAVPSAQLQLGDWVGIDIPINGFTNPTGGGFSGSPNLNNIARVVLVSNGGSFLIDNIYFYRN